MFEFLKKLFGIMPAAGESPGAGRGRAEEGLRRVEQRFEQLVAGVRDYAIFLLDTGGHVQTWNAGAERVKGYRPDEIIGQHFSRFYPKEAAASGWPAHELKVAAETGRFEDEGWRVRKDGSRFWANVVITALRDEAGELRGFLKITRDMTDRRQAEEKLRLSEERFRLIVESVRDYAIFMLDPQGTVVTWNTGAERVYGYTPDGIIGQQFSRLFPKEAVERGWPEDMLRRAAAEGRCEDEGWRIRQDGSRFWASVTVAAMRDESGSLRGFSKVTRDMTERREAEEKARRLLLEEAAREAAEANAHAARHAQQEERRQREQLRVTLASIGDAVIVTDTDGRVTFLNAVAQSLTGWEAAEAAGRPLDDVFRIVNEETRQPAEPPVGKVLREGLVVGLANHTVLVARDGREVPIDDSAAPIRGEGGAVAGVVLVFRDVTEARRAIESRLHLAAIVESSDDAIISHDLGGVIVSWNRGAERLYGYMPEEAVGRPLTLLTLPGQAEEVPRILDLLRRGERIDHYETVRVRKDGSCVEVSLTISPVRNAEGKVVGASKIARDVTAARRHEAGLRFLAEASKVLGEQLDVSGTLQKVAALAVPQFADWCAVDLLGEDGSLRRVAVAHADPAKVELARELHRRYPPDPGARVGAWNVLRTRRPELLPDIPDSLLQETVKDPELLRVVRDLGLRSYLGVPLVVRDEVLGVFTFVLAESGRRYGPDDLRLAEDLAYRVAIALENARLYGELKEADRRKDEFLAMLSHELRNPLAPIRNALHLMKLPGANSEAVEHARQMTERQVAHMVRLVDDLLDVSRIMQGKVELRKEPAELAGVIASAVETAQPVIDAAGQQLLVSVPDEPLRLEADPVRLAQAIGNLLHNAAKFSQRAGRIWLTAGREGGEAVVRVRDEGAGIHPDLLPSIFDLFVQGDRSLERSQGGLGIGLTLVRKLIEQHGGTVTAHSAGPGKGSEFVVRLPGLLPASVPAPAAGAAPPAHAAPRRVLVVDDNVDAAESTAMLLRMWGHEVRLAHNGPEALRAAEPFRPEVVLLDIGLPGMSGYEVARRLREQPGSRDAVLIAVTGYGHEDDRRTSAGAGIDYHLTKPVDPEVLEPLLAQPRRPQGSEQASQAGA